VAHHPEAVSASLMIMKQMATVLTIWKPTQRNR
jgi:hypothetical protein